MSRVTTTSDDRLAVISKPGAGFRVLVWREAVLVGGSVRRRLSGLQL